MANDDWGCVKICMTDTTETGKTMTAATGFVLPEPEIAAICRRYQVRELCLFGSAARGDMRLNSDVDLLVDFFT